MKVYFVADDSTPEGREEVRRLANAARLESALVAHLDDLRRLIQHGVGVGNTTEHASDWRARVHELREELLSDMAYDPDDVP